MKIDRIIRKVSKNMNLKIIDCIKTCYWEKSGMEKEDYINKSYTCGNEIILGIYDDLELKLISFFHEVGHIASILFNEEIENKYEQEKLAWDVGLQIAASYGVYFSEKTENWANQQLETYNT